VVVLAQRPAGPVSRQPSSAQRALSHASPAPGSLGRRLASERLESRGRSVHARFAVRQGSLGPGPVTPVVMGAALPGGAAPRLGRPRTGRGS